MVGDTAFSLELVFLDVLLAVEVICCLQLLEGGLGDIDRWGIDLRGGLRPRWTECPQCRLGLSFKTRAERRR